MLCARRDERKGEENLPQCPKPPKLGAGLISPVFAGSSSAAVMPDTGSMSQWSWGCGHPQLQLLPWEPTAPGTVGRARAFFLWNLVVEREKGARSGNQSQTRVGFPHHQLSLRRSVPSAATNHLPRAGAFGSCPGCNSLFPSFPALGWNRGWGPTRDITTAVTEWREVGLWL